MFKLMLGFISGVILLYFSGELINSSKETLKFYVCLQIVFLLPFFLLFAFKRFRQSYLKSLLVCLTSLFCGFNYAYQVAVSLNSAQISPVYDQTSIALTGFLCSLPRYGEFAVTADYCLLEVLNAEGERLPGSGLKARLRWPLDLAFSEGVSKLKIISQQPKSSVNFIGSSYETSLFYQRIVLVGKVEEQIKMLSSDELTYIDNLRFQYHQLRLMLSKYIDSLLVDLDHKGIIRALLIGDKSQLSVSDFKTLSNSGTQHLIAISGLHVGLVMLCFYYVFPKTKMSFVMVGMIGLMYVFLVGFSPSAQRAWIMCLCTLISFSGFIKRKPWSAFLFSLFVVLLLDPLSTLNLGFWFSFSCVAIIFLSIQLIDIQNNKMASLFVFQSILLVAMIPIASLLGLKHGLENIFANLLAVPWISLLILPMALLCLFVSLVFSNLASVLLVFLNTFIELLIAYISSLKLLRWPLSIEVHYIELLCFSLTLFGLFWLSNIRIFASISLVSIFISIMLPSTLYSDDFEFSVFDVGQGLAIAIKSQGDIWLYDLGPAFKRSSSTSQTVLPYLRKHQKSNLLKGVILSHGDADHAGDVRSLYDEYQPVIALSGEPERIQDSQFQYCASGRVWENSEMKIEVLYPYAGVDLTHSSANNHSCVVRISVLGKVFLLMGDLDEGAELSLVAKYREALKSDVLIAAHHGASKSSSYALLKHVQPEFAVLSAGYLNRFGHPAADVLDRLSQFDIKILNTIETGGISFKLDSSPSRIEVSYARNVVKSSLYMENLAKK